MGEDLKIYNELSHEFAKKQLLERFKFELEANSKIFKDNKVSLERLKNDCRGNEVFSDAEYKKLYKESKNNLKEYIIEENGKFILKNKE